MKKFTTLLVQIAVLLKQIAVLLEQIAVFPTEFVTPSSTHAPPSLILAGPALAETLHALKRHTAAALLEQIRSENRDWLLNQLAYYKAAHKTASRHQVWQEGVHPQAIAGDEMMLQSRAERDRLAARPARRVPAEAGINIDYIHHNPVQRGWVVAPEHWRYSSAHEWLPGAQPLLKCDPWR